MCRRTKPGKLYPGENSDIVNETGLIIKRLQMNENIESILKDFAERSGIEEIQHFADVFRFPRGQAETWWK